MNIQAAISAARILPNVPENSGDKENNSQKNGCHDSGKAKSFDLFERFFEAEKENIANHLNAFDGPNKLFVTSVNGRVRNLSDTNLVSYQAQYRLPILKDTKCSSDTNLAVSVNGKQALIHRQDVMKLSLKQHPFGLCNSPTLSSASPIEEENPSDISPDESPVTGPKHKLSHDVPKCDVQSSNESTRVQGNSTALDSNSDALPSPFLSKILSSTDMPLSDLSLNVQSTTENVTQAQVSCPIIALEKSSSQTVNRILDAEDFSSIKELEEGNSTLLAGSYSARDNAQSRSGSRSSLKYVYNELTSTDSNSCYTIAETRSTKDSAVAIPGRTQQSDIPRYSVSKFGRLVTNTPVNSKCCTII